MDMFIKSLVEVLEMILGHPATGMQMILTGLAAARNTEPYLLQKYARDTGEKMADLSVPIFIRNQHWGAVRIGYKD